MLKDAEIAEQIEQIAKAKLGRDNVIRVFTEPGSDWTGQDAVRITIVLPPDAAERIDGDNALDMLVEIHNRFYEAQDDRIPIVHYATEQELAAGDDPEC